MKRIFTVISLIVIGFFNIQQTKAQEFETIVTSGITDANTYLKNYMNPFAASLGNGLANGWYNTAKPHKTLGFDLTVNMNFAIIPDAASQFDFNDDTYNNLRLANPSEGSMLPTFTGNTTDTRLEIFGEREIDGETYNFEQEIVAPDGFGLSDLPGPLAVSFRSFGFGVKHDFKQWIPGMKLLPFDLSGLVGYNKISTTYQIDETAGQFAEFGASATTIQAIISKKLLFFTPYAGLGLNIVNSNFAMRGDYVFNENTNEEVTVTDPIDIAFDGSGGPRFTVGARVKILWVLALNVDYTIQKYNTLSVGVGLNIR